MNIDDVDRDCEIDEMEKLARGDDREIVGRRRRTITPAAPARPFPTDQTSG